MSKATGVPDAWDDDWENAADRPDPISAPQQPVKVSRAERKAQHQEANKQLWQAAEQPDTFHFLQTKDRVPTKADFRPTVKVLSRKPQPATLLNPTSTTKGLVIDDGDDSEEEDRKRREANFIERQRTAQIEREEKQRKYAEVRERLFGSPASHSTSRESSSASQTRNPLNPDSRNPSRKPSSRATKDTLPAYATQLPAPSPQPKQLYDPSYDARPKTRSPRPGAPKEEQPIRAPRGPDNTGRGGFGFAPRGGLSGKS